ncbi:hypothetical protein RRG08_031923 [Elysia crispata]|uniref:Uncharacterized protein n=1 Tax=Elysia crispata TaxID=231223 RepID=A0AAE1DYJ2_9GAST|nr:hypothetical protein RRG08_031923 [Elysia crispata]
MAGLDLNTKVHLSVWSVVCREELSSNLHQYYFIRLPRLSDHPWAVLSACQSPAHSTLDLLTLTTPAPCQHLMSCVTGGECLGSKSNGVLRTLRTLSLSAYVAGQNL